MACSESEGLTQNNLSTDKITFNAVIQNGWNAGSATPEQRATSRVVENANENGALRVQANFSKPLYLLPVEQEGIHVWNEKNQPITRGGKLLSDVQQERVVVTRGSKKTSISDYDKFGVTALYPNSSSNDYSVLLDNREVTSAGTNWHVADADNALWPWDAKVSFHAYAPHSTQASMLTSVAANATDVSTTVHYSALSSSTDIPNQPDLIVATQTGSRSKTTANTAVPLQFSHALTAVTFAISSDLKEVIGDGQLTEVSLLGIPSEADCVLKAQDDKNAAASHDWSNWTNPQDYTFSLSGINLGNDYALTSGDKTLMMIPQTLPAGAKVVFKFQINGADQTLSVDLSGQNWAAGSSIIYKLSAKNINTLNAADIAYPTTWASYSYPKTDFDANESLGLYVVDNNGKLVASNVKVTKQSDGTWKIDSRVLKLSKYKYFAYYPYSETAPNVDDASTSDAATFFNNKIANWSLNADQSSDVLSQDLQVAEGVVAADASTLTFTMAHQMGLAVLDLKSKDIVKTRRFTNNNYTYYYKDLAGRATTEPVMGTDYETENDKTEKQSVMASNNFSGTNKPYLTTTANRYIQIVKPNTEIAYQAADQANTPRSAWGSSALGKACTFKANSAGEVVEKSITTDAEFYYLARVYSYAGSGNGTGKVEEFTAPAAGEYKLECWGAQGGYGHIQTTGHGGKGGYAVGTIQINAVGIKLYIAVGGKGDDMSSYRQFAAGGFNGGGKSMGNVNTAWGGGGGATSISYRTGTIADLSGYKNQIIIVAGGGGGGGHCYAEGSNSYPPHAGGDGGGTTGGNGATDDNDGGAGATKLGGYAFGKGQDGKETQGEGASYYYGSGGGGGYYGGYSGYTHGSAAGGGSGFLSSSILSGTGNMTNGAREGNGEAVVAWFLN